MEFTWTKQDVRVAHLNLREEMHGETSKQVVDVKLSASMANDFLTYLSPGLKESLYAAPEQQDLVQDDKYMPRLRHACLATPLKIVGAMHKATATFHGQSKKFDWEVESKVGKVELVPLDGGTVNVTLNVTFYNTPEQMSVLCALLGKDSKVSIVAPDVEEADPDAGS